MASRKSKKRSYKKRRTYRKKYGKTAYRKKYGRKSYKKSSYRKKYGRKKSKAPVIYPTAVKQMPELNRQKLSTVVKEAMQKADAVANKIVLDKISVKTEMSDEQRAAAGLAAAAAAAVAEAAASARPDKRMKMETQMQTY